MKDYIASLNLVDVHNFLMSGDPPLIVQILALNTVFMVLFLLRRVRAAKQGQPVHVTFTLQWILIVSMVGVMLEDKWLPYVDDSKSMIFDRYQRVVAP